MAKRKPDAIASALRNTIGCWVARFLGCSGTSRDTQQLSNSATEKPSNYFLNSASNALRASSGVWILPALSAARSLTTLAWKNVHSLRACLFATRAGMFSRHSHVVVVSKERQLPQVWISAPHFTQVSSNVGASR